MDQVKIGKFIASLRKDKGMTQQQLGDKIGVSFKTISKWETGRGLPELSLLKPLSEELGVTINEILSGERIKDEQYLHKLEENMINTIEYSEKQKDQTRSTLGITLLVGGFLLTLIAVMIFPTDSSLSPFFAIAGGIIALVGFSRLIRKLEYHKRVPLNLGFFIVYTGLLFLLDYINVISNDAPPRFTLKTEIFDNNVVYDTPFYNVYRINKDTVNEYYIVDTAQDYTIDTVPLSPFNRNKSGIDNIARYKNSYIGDNSNTGNLISNLPLSEYGYVIEIDSDKLGLTIDYHITDWYINDQLYLEKSLIYNSVCIFALIENVEYITFNFTGNSYSVSRDTIESTYPNYSDMDKNEISSDIFNKYVEQKITDDEFVETTFDSLFAR